ncbi:uroporphyrin-III C-methyltransferase [Alkaliphilus metalliredigens QYMF]|uniref:uroporphyrinogen-III C-methyltransferase n=1 Tax=Alkaliphilus metalliredigens (strain QYMF) TaxID=293826 RepID=A6TJD6_ALKMQ|nr:uroporphyrinogen-III C-methyltransferase [Alkaliphilus metalliredigens]ABR46304.1 uroporphyrin-III C-methyltransferase [Alkaliphilus metalliredigens QYMF]
MSKGYVYLVGAGPGDEELITVKGLRCIQEADVILYDRLANPALLKNKRDEAECIDVGKSPKRHAYTQEEINELLVLQAHKGKTVTRLKGGDPYVFGRGGEEALALRKARIPFEVVPGITSAIAVPNYGGIPVTHRNVSTSFHVITGHEDPLKEKSSVNYEALAKLEGTLVFLMGVGNLEEIVNQLRRYGKPKETPIALVHQGTTAKQRTVTGTLESIVTVVKEKKITSPSVIVIGEVVRLQDELNWFESLPLHGQRILVTRTREQASQLSTKLKALGGDVVEYPTIEIRPAQDIEGVNAKLKRIHQGDYIIFTSVNGVKAFFERLKALKMDVREMGPGKLVAIGPATAKALEEKGLLVEVIPETYVAEGIIDCLKESIKEGDKVFLPRANIARKALNEGLEALGAQVEEIEIYETVLPVQGEQHLRELLVEGIDWITFTSSSTVQNFMDLLGKEDRHLLESVKIASIGPITGKTAKKLGLPVDVQAKEYTIAGLVQAMMEVQ